MGAWEHGSLGAWEPGSVGASEPGIESMGSSEFESRGACESGGLGAWELVIDRLGAWETCHPRAIKLPCDDHVRGGDSLSGDRSPPKHGASTPEEPRSSREVRSKLEHFAQSSGEV